MSIGEMICFITRWSIQSMGKSCVDSKCIATKLNAISALGLTPPNAKTSAYSPLTAPNPLYELMKSRALEHNTLTLILPSSTKDSGALRLGMPPQASDDTIRIPFANATDLGLDNSWNVPLNSVSLGGQTKLELPLANRSNLQSHRRQARQPVLRRFDRLQSAGEIARLGFEYRRP
jgi:hypothetical protein